ncbi:MAG TPA: NAD(P)-binding domain-containing protein [Ktedonobacterales bacterium]|nr:NAD(P)-binding domain-containing protein [Ktedonobacterales bacterium]
MARETDVVIVGAGAAGLATAACLKRLGVASEVLEASEQAGHSWAAAYDALHLHTVRRYSSLPGWPMPRRYPRYAARDQVVAYLEAYATHFGIAPRYGQRVTRAEPTGEGGWRVTTQAGEEWVARVLVAASGVVANPVTAAYPGMDEYGGKLLHSREYRNAAPFAGQRVLVVGAGNSGAEIAVDLLEGGAAVTVAIRVGVNAVPLSLLGVPIQYWALLVAKLPPSVTRVVTKALLRRSEARLKAAGMPKSPEPILQAHGIPIIGLRLLEAARAGKIKITGAIERFEPDGVAFKDGTRQPFDAVIMATGYRPALGYLDGLVTLDERGFPARDMVTSLDQPSLFFVGFNYGLAGTLNIIRREAPIAAQRIAALLRSSAPAVASRA